VHTAATLLLPVAAEKSRVPFYIAGGLLASWAVILSVLLGLRKPAFPGGVAGQRVVIAISAVLVLGAVSMAVLTSGAPAKSAAAAQSTPPPSSPAPEAPAGGSAPAAQTSTPAPATPSPNKSRSGRKGRKKASSTGTPARPSAATSIALAASPTGLSYDKKQLSAKAGAVTITLTNPAQLEHNVTIAEGSKVLGATPSFVGSSRALTLTLTAGTYTFYCSVPGHRQGGMEGTLIVT
jgi:plastocyanin